MTDVYLVMLLITLIAGIYLLRHRPWSEAPHGGVCLTEAGRASVDLQLARVSAALVARDIVAAQAQLTMARDQLMGRRGAPVRDFVPQ